MNLSSYLSSKVRLVPDFPTKGVLFRDITTLLNDRKAFNLMIKELTRRFENSKVDAVAAVESRGFILGAPLAYRLGAAFIPIRKGGRLPSKKIQVNYRLEYGTAVLEVHEDAINSGKRVLIVDDVLATGGTASNAGELIRRLGGKIAAFAFLIELTALRGREKLSSHRVVSLIKDPRV